MAKRETKTKAIAAHTAGPDDSLERAHGAPGVRVAGVDEAGRGPIAGPVVTAAVVLDWSRVPAGLNDSKKLTAARREALFEAILADHGVAIAFSSVERIDVTDIRAATLDAMRRAVKGLGLPPDHVLVDGIDVPPGLPCPGTAVVEGDARSLTIAAASIVAKVLRDRLMEKAGAEHPGYGLEKHKGYGTADHMAALSRLGATPLHRRSFAPVARALGLPPKEKPPAKAKVPRPKAAGGSQGDLFG